MANTTIQLKYSTLTATPSSLNVAEPAYSYSSNTLFIGSPAGTGSIAIGGTIPTALTASKVVYITGYRYVGEIGLSTIQGGTF